LALHLFSVLLLRHDTIIGNIAYELKAKGLLVGVNPNNSKNYSVRRGDEVFYPDIYVYNEKFNPLHNLLFICIKIRKLASKVGEKG